MPPSLSLSFGRRSRNDVVGLDIQPGLVAAVQTRMNGALLVERATALPLPADTVREGDVLDPAALSDVLRTLFQRSRLSKHVRIGVANQRTVMRTLELPPLTDDRELAAAVRFQAQDQVPMPLANAVLDFQPLGIVDTPAGPRQKVVLVAAQRDMVERLLAAVRGAGLTPVGVDMSAFALIRSLYRRDADHTGRVLYLNVDGLTNVAIAEGIACRFTRVLGGGIEEMVAELAERRGIPLDHARELLGEVDLSAAGADGPPRPALAAAPKAHVPHVPVQQSAEVAAEEEEGTGSQESSAPDAYSHGEQAEASTSAHEPEPDSDSDEAEHLQSPAAEPPLEPQMYSEDLMPSGEPTAAEVARTVLQNGVRAIAGEVRNSIDFHRSQEGGADVTRVVLSGSALEFSGFAEALQASLGVEVHGETVGVADSSLLRGVSAHRLAVATGLTSGEVRQ
jgi:type IV pilus assembly protein PilM